MVLALLVFVFYNCRRPESQNRGVTLSPPRLAPKLTISEGRAKIPVDNFTHAGKQQVLKIGANTCADKY